MNELQIKIDEAAKKYRDAFEDVERQRGVIKGYTQALKDCFGEHGWAGACPESALKKLAELNDDLDDIEAARAAAQKKLHALYNGVEEAHDAVSVVDVVETRVRKSGGSLDLFARVSLGERSGWVVAKIPADHFNGAIWGPAFDDDFAANLVDGKDFISFSGVWSLNFSPAPRSFEPLMEDDDEIAGYRARLPVLAAALNSAIERARA